MGRSLASAILLVSAAACGDPEIIVPDVLWAHTTPDHGTSGISISVEPLVYFTSPVASVAAAADKISLTCLGSPPCATAAGQGCGSDPTVVTNVTFEVDQVAHIAPDAALARNTCYGIHVGDGIEAADKNVGPLPAEIRAAFETTP